MKSTQISGGGLRGLLSSWLYPTEPANFKRHHDSFKIEDMEEPKQWVSSCVPSRTGLRINPAARERQLQRLQSYEQQKQQQQQQQQQQEQYHSRTSTAPPPSLPMNIAAQGNSWQPLLTPGPPGPTPAWDQVWHGCAHALRQLQQMQEESGRQQERLLQAPQPGHQEQVALCASHILAQQQLQRSLAALIQQAQQRAQQTQQADMQQELQQQQQQWRRRQQQQQQVPCAQIPAGSAAQASSGSMQLPASWQSGATEGLQACVASHGQAAVAHAGAHPYASEALQAEAARGFGGAESDWGSVCSTLASTSPSPSLLASSTPGAGLDGAQLLSQHSQQWQHVGLLAHGEQQQQQEEDEVVEEQCLQQQQEQQQQRRQLQERHLRRLHQEQCAAFQVLLLEHSQLQADCEELKSQVLALTEDLNRAQQEAEAGASATQQLQQVLCALDSSLNDEYAEHAQTKLALAAATAENSRLIEMMHEGSLRGGRFERGGLPALSRASAPVAGS